MDLAAVMDQVAARAGTIAGLRAYAYPAMKISPPAAVLGYPDAIDPHGTYNRGLAKINLPLVVCAGRASARAARDQLAKYVNSTGANSLVAVLESGTYAAFDVLTVVKITCDVVTIAAVDYAAALFDLEIQGSGV